MLIGKTLFRLWITLSLMSVAIDAACFWAAQHAPAPLPDKPSINYVMIFLVSAPAPLALGVLMTAFGMLLGLLRWMCLSTVRIVTHRAAPLRPQPIARPREFPVSHKAA
jgi:hypothetical protein